LGRHKHARHALDAVWGSFGDPALRQLLFQRSANDHRIAAKLSRLNGANRLAEGGVHVLGPIHALNLSARARVHSPERTSSHLSEAVRF